MTRTATGESFKSPLHEMTQTTPTCLWNDSASIQELRYSIEHGAVGATCNPVIVLGVLKKEMPQWKDRIQSLIREWPTATEDEIAWQLVREISCKSAALLKPIFDAQRGRNGRLSIQTDPRFFRDTESIIRQAEEFSKLAPNIIVKIPVTRAGIPAIEEATYRGISINATVCFALPQCIAVAEAVERGLKRREKEGKEIATMGPVCTIMVGRLDDWLKVAAEKENISDRSRLSRMGRRRGFQENLQDLSRARLPHSAALGRFSKSHALERIHRWRRGDLASLRLASPFQRQRYRGAISHRQARGNPNPRRTNEEVR